MIEGASTVFENPMQAPQDSALADLIAGHPEIVAVVLLIVSLVLARGGRFLTERGLALFSRSAARVAGGRGELLPDRTVGLIGTLVFWTILVIGFLLALRTLGTGRVFTWIDVPLAYVPRIFIGLVIVGAGWVLGVLARGVVARLQSGATEASLTPRVVQGGVVLLAVITGLQHVGLDVSFIAQLLILVVGVCLAGLSLAFALGARQYVANLLARGAATRYATGDRLRVDAVEGTVVEIHRGGVDLATTDGIVTVPAARFAEAPVLRRTTGQAEGQSEGSDNG